MEKILVTRSSMPELEEYVDEIKELWDSHWLTNMGKKHEVFRSMLKDYLEVPHIELLTNGHMALEIALQSLDVTGEVITTPFTFASTTHAIVRSGFTPVFCDISEKDYCIDVSKIENLITDKTVAILPVHVYGNICDVEAIENIAKKHSIKVIYDAAHAFGVKYKNKGIANYGDASCYSFHATKVFNTIEGGAICSNTLNNSAIFALKDFGIDSDDYVNYIGTNAKMNEFCAAMGICNLRHINEEIEKRRNHVELYQQLLKDVRGLKIWNKQDDVDSSYSYFPILVNASEYGHSREWILAKLEENDIYGRKYFYPLTNEFPCYQNANFRGNTPVAKYCSENIITVPLFAELTSTQIERICNIIK